MWMLKELWIFGKDPQGLQTASNQLNSGRPVSHRPALLRTESDARPISFAYLEKLSWNLNIEIEKKGKISRWIEIDKLIYRKLSNWFQELQF